MTTPDVLEVKPDGRKSRLTQKTPAPDVDLDDITTVDAKVAEFWTRFPDGAIDASKVQQIGPDAWKVTAKVWRINPRADFQGGPFPDSTGTALRTVDLDGHASGAFPLETAQSIAIGRALRFMGITGHGDHLDGSTT